MQSWGVQSRFGVRDTGREPSKSGVIGLLCAALGRPRSAALDDLVALRMGVRVDQEGHIAKDFQTIRKTTPEGKLIGNPDISNRYYLADAAFLVGLEGDVNLLSILHSSLRSPRWMIYLGRKAFIPAEPVWISDGMQEGQSLISALRTYPFIASLSITDFPESLRVVIEDSEGDRSMCDSPVSFETRQYFSRRVRTMYIPTPPALLIQSRDKEAPCTSHS
jgi:CRISPR system Cascade subunit CasD